MAFDAYHKWLGIPPAEQPPDHYRLLGVALFEGDHDVLESAADRQMAHVRTFQSGPHSALSQKILNELAAAKLCLLDPQKRSIYDVGLRQRNEVAIGAAKPVAPAPVRPMATPPPARGIKRAEANAACPEAAVLLGFALGKLDEATEDAVSRHLDGCAACRQKAANVSSDGFIDRLRAAEAQPHFDRTFGEREAADGLETTVDQPKAREGAADRKSRAAVSQSELAEHPDYEIVRELGHGGMGTVYLAKNRLMDRLEVLKVLSKSLLERPGALDRFQQEIRSAAKLGHVNIVAAHSVIRMGDSLVFAMEYVPGQDLAHVVERRGPLRVPNAAYYAHQAALGLQHAHEKGMVHRDIKPNNLMLATDGKKHIVKILDFGLAKATSEKTEETGLTKSGQILGTPDYLAPEQIRDAQRADIRADIYSLGCTLYFLLSAQRPFPGQSLYDVLDAHQKREAKPLDHVRPEVPRELAAIVAKMMAKDPADRYQTPVEVARALIPFFKPSQTAPAPETISPEPVDAAQIGMAPHHTSQSQTPPPKAWPMPQAALPTAPPRAVPMAAPLSRSAFDTSIDFESPLFDTEQELPAAFRPWRRYVATCGAAVLVMLGIALLTRTPHRDATLVVDWPLEERRGAQFLVDENAEVVPQQNPFEIPLVPGKHHVVLRRSGYQQIEWRLDLDHGVREEKRVAWEKLAELSPSRIDVELADQTDLSAESNDIHNDTSAKRFLPTASEPPPLAIAPFAAEQTRAHQEAWSKFLGVPLEHTNSLGMKFVLIPPGEFVMGSTAAQIKETLALTGNVPVLQEYVTSEAPQHPVRLTRPIYLGAFEVTQEQYQKVMGKNPAYFTESGAAKAWVDKIANLNTADFPVEGVSWNDAAEFCAKLSEQEKLKPFYHRNAGTVTMIAGNGYQLPTEAQWEFACRAGATTKYSAGEKDEDLTQAGWVIVNSDFRPHRVGELKANPFGLHDMHGNVKEWVQDRWAADYYGQFQGSVAIDPSGPIADSRRIVRGGDWRQAACLCRAASREHEVASFFRSTIGFRISLPIEAVQSAIATSGNDVPVVRGNKRAATSPPSNVVPTEQKQAGADQGSKAADSIAATSAKGYAADSANWVPLFNGKDLTGWKTHPQQPGKWGVENGVLIGSGASASYLFSERGNYTNFRLRVEARINDGGDSGIFCRSTFEPSGSGSPGGYEAQINSTGADDNKTGSVYGPRGSMISVITSRARPNEWFTLELTARGNQLETTVNGQTTAHYSDPDRTVGAGHIALQHHDARTLIEFRKIEISEEQPPAETAASEPPRAVAPFDGKQATSKDATASPLPVDDPTFRQWFEEVAAMPAKKQVESVTEKLRERNPGFKGKLAPKIEGGAVTALSLSCTNVTDISPVGALTGLKSLTCSNNTSKRAPLADLTPLKHLSLSQFVAWYTSITDLSPLREMPLTSLTLTWSEVSDLSPLTGMRLANLQLQSTKVADLTPLRGMPLQHLDVLGTKITELSAVAATPLVSLQCANTSVADLTPLRGLRLTSLNCGYSQVADLGPLAGMPLNTLSCYNTKVADLEPLRGMRLSALNASGTKVLDISPLRGMPLTSLQLSGTPVADLSPLKGMPLSVIAVNGTKVSDLSPLKDLPLTSLHCDFQLDRDSSVLSSITTLKHVNGMTPDKFWKKANSGRK